MQTIERSFTFTTAVNRSKFIAHLVPISGYEELQEKLKREHPKANHVVYALRYLNDFEQIVENSSDNGEPKGCAGVPVLNVLRGEKLINCVVRIVRYFGGIKLGTGGMARAYSKAVKNVLNKAELVSYEKQIEYSFATTYSDVDKILYTLNLIGIVNYERDFEVDGVDWKIVGSEENIEHFKEMKGL